MKNEVFTGWATLLFELKVGKEESSEMRFLDNGETQDWARSVLLQDNPSEVAP
jgi:hypothetical protein